MTSLNLGLLAEIVVLIGIFFYVRAIFQIKKHNGNK